MEAQHAGLGSGGDAKQGAEAAAHVKDLRGRRYESPSVRTQMLSRPSTDVGKWCKDANVMSFCKDTDAVVSTNGCRKRGWGFWVHQQGLCGEGKGCHQERTAVGEEAQGGT